MSAAGDPRPRSRAWKSHALFALVAGLLALASLAGWSTGIHRFTTFLEGRPSLSPMTALAMLAAAAASLTMPGRRRVALVLGGAVAAGGLLIVVAQVAGWPDAGWIAAEWWSSRLTGVMFALSGSAAMLLAWGRCAAGQIVALGVLLFASLIGLGHIFPFAKLYDLMPGTGVSIPSVLGFMALATSLLLARRDSGITGALTSQSAAGRIGLRLLFLGLSAVFALALLIVAARRYEAFDADTAVLLVAWGAMTMLGSTVWGLALAVARAERSRRAAEQERDRMQQMVAAAAAHDLRNPLAAAMLAGALLGRLVADPRAAQAVRRLDRCHRRLDRLLRSLLDSMAVGNGRALVMQASRVSLPELIAEVVEQSEGGLAERVVCTGDAQGWWDRDALFRVIENLLLNALKYGDRGSPIACRITVRHDAEVLLSVSNRGPSIPVGEWETIFQPFARGRRLAGSDLAGWGIGLAYARAVAQGHGGGIRVAASDAAGTRFELCLPVDSRRALGDPADRPG